MSRRTCAYHEERPAIAICQACRADICAQCHRASVTGYALCRECERKIRSLLLTPWEAAGSLDELLTGFWATAAAALSSPRAFFARLAPVGGWVRPALFGAACYGTGAAASYIYNWAFAANFDEFIRNYSTSVELSTRGAAVLLLLAIPLAAPFAFGLHSFLLWVSLRMFGARASWRVVTRVAGYSSAAYLLQIIPPIHEFPLGYLLSIIWFVNLELIGVRRYFQELGIWASMAAVFVPFLALSFLSI